jgi:hypothetical protein
MSEIKQILEALTSEGSTEAVQDLTKSLRELLEVQTKLGITYRDLSESGRDVTRALEAGGTSASSFADKAFGLGEKIGSLGGLLKENENGIMANAKGFLEMATGGENAAASMADRGNGGTRSSHRCGFYAIQQIHWCAGYVRQPDDLTAKRHFPLGCWH